MQLDSSTRVQVHESTQLVLQIFRTPQELRNGDQPDFDH